MSLNAYEYFVVQMKVKYQWILMNIFALQKQVKHHWIIMNIFVLQKKIICIRDVHEYFCDTKKKH